MKTIFDKKIREQLVTRINNIDDMSKGKWGKMNVFQMLKHNIYWNEWILGKNNEEYKQTFLGKIFGRIALKRMIKDEKPLDKNVPTSEEHKSKEKFGNIALDKNNWISLVTEYKNFNNPKFIHDFFGKMTNDEIGILVYKHTDHHLRQFGV